MGVEFRVQALSFQSWCFQHHHLPKQHLSLNTLWQNIHCCLLVLLAEPKKENRVLFLREKMMLKVILREIYFRINEPILCLSSYLRVDNYLHKFKIKIMFGAEKLC